MASSYLKCIVLGCWVLAACTPQLEREGVPLLAGINLDPGCGTGAMEHNWETYQTYDLSGWMIEIPFRVSPDPKNPVFTYYATHTLDTLLPQLQAHSSPYSLAFSLEKPPGMPMPQVRMETYLTDISGILLRTVSYPPRQLVFMGAFIDEASRLEKVRDFLIQLKTGFPAFQGEIVFAGYPDQLTTDFDWETPDVIGIRHQAPAHQNYREYFRTQHQQISEQLLAHHKPALIVQSNLLGEDKLLLLKNQLRFWHDSVAIQGIVLNTLYCRMSLTDSSSYYSLTKEADVLEFLSNYP